MGTLTPGAGANTVFVLGAGFSKACFDAMPIADELGERVALRLGASGESVGVARRVLDGTTSQGFEGYLSSLAERHPHQSQAEWLEAQAILSRLIPVIADELVETQRAISNGVEAPWWLRTFLELAAVTSASVATFNYDTIVEAHWPHGWGLGIDELGANPSELPVRYPVEGVQGWRDPASARCGLYKLHGSVNWLASEADQHGSTLIINRENLALEGYFHDEAERATGAAAPVIVPPTSVKYTSLGRSFLAATWTQARRRLERADRVVLLGYSLPETDRSAAALLRDAIRDRDVDLVVVDLDASSVSSRLSKMGIHEGPCLEFTGSSAVADFVRRELDRARANAVLAPTDVGDFSRTTVYVRVVSPGLPDGVVAVEESGSGAALVATADGTHRSAYSDVARVASQPNEWELADGRDSDRVLPILEVRTERTADGAPSTMTVVCGSPVPRSAIGE